MRDKQEERAGNRLWMPELSHLKATGNKNVKEIRYLLLMVRAMQFAIVSRAVKLMMMVVVIVVAAVVIVL